LVLPPAQSIARCPATLCSERADWAESERNACAYFAAVALDRRIAYNRDLMAQQISNSL